jgi:hypothetical protein
MQCGIDGGGSASRTAERLAKQDALERYDSVRFFACLLQAIVFRRVESFMPTINQLVRKTGRRGVEEQSPGFQYTLLDYRSALAVRRARRKSAQRRTVVKTMTRRNRTPLCGSRASRLRTASKSQRTFPVKVTAYRNTASSPCTRWS